MKLGQYLTFIFLFPFYQVIKIDRFLRIYPQKRILKYEYCRNLQINCCDKSISKGMKKYLPNKEVRFK